MADFIKAPSAIEAEEIFVSTMAYTSNRTPVLLLFGKVKKPVYPVTLKRDGRGKIVKELAPQAERFDAAATTALNTTVIGQTVSGYSGDPIGKVAVGASGGKSGAHKRQSFTLTDWAYLRIVQGKIGPPIAMPALTSTVSSSLQLTA